MTNYINSYANIFELQDAISHRQLNEISKNKSTGKLPAGILIAVGILLLMTIIFIEKPDHGLIPETPEDKKYG